jgi:hypothetical protein
MDVGAVAHYLAAPGAASGATAASSALECPAARRVDGRLIELPTTSALDVTAVVRCCTPASISQSAEPVWVAIGR